jgi:hypothetical protein
LRLFRLATTTERFQPFCALSQLTRRQPVKGTGRQVPGHADQQAVAAATTAFDDERGARLNLAQAFAQNATLTFKGRLEQTRHVPFVSDSTKPGNLGTIGQRRVSIDLGRQFLTERRHLQGALGERRQSIRGGRQFVGGTWTRVDQRRLVNAGCDLIEAFFDLINGMRYQVERIPVTVV